MRLPEVGRDGPRNAGVLGRDGSYPSRGGQAMTEPLTPEEERNLRILLKSGPPPHVTDGQAWALLATLDAAREREGRLRAALERVLHAWRGSTVHGEQMTALRE